QRHDRDPVADRPFVDARTELRNAPGHLVPDHRRPPHPVVHSTMQEVECGAADSRIRHIEADFTGPGRDYFAVADEEGLVADVFSAPGCTHRATGGLGTSLPFAW